MPEVPVQNRLSMLICPDIRPESSWKKQPSNWVLMLAKSRTSILKSFMEMPVDIIFEIASCLHPRDLLNLSRSSKHLRAVFFHRSSVVVWKGVLRKAGFPECPGDISEPQYTSLMFDTNFCMACSATTENIICDFGLRLRLCSTCWGINVIHGALFCPLPVAVDAVFTLIPANGSKNATSWKNNALNFYFKPELEAAMVEEEHHYKSMSPKEFYKWVDERRAAATRMMQEGITLEHWYHEWHATDKRSTKIHNEMEKLGWNNAFFPPLDSDDYPNWNALMVSSSELDDNGLADVMQKLTIIYARRRKESITKRSTSEAESYYRNHRYQLPMEKFVCVPGWEDVASYHCIQRFIQDRLDNHENENLDVLMEEIIDEGKKKFVPQFEAMLVDAVKVCDPSQIRISKKRIMGRAVNLFFCTCKVCAQKMTDGFRNAYGYPEIVDHIMKSEGHWSEQPPSTDLVLIQAARDILKALGLPENSTREALKDFGNVCCQCGHWGCEKPITFERLVEHVYNQRLCAAEMQKKANPTPSKEFLDTLRLLLEGHSRGKLTSLIIRAPDQSGSSG